MRRIRQAAVAATAVLAAILGCAAFPVRAAGSVDPLHSPGWRWMQARYFEGSTVVFDERVRVTAPASAEDSLAVPVSVDASGLGEAVQEILVFADLNPITTILRYEPMAARPALSFRFKIQQSTPVRAAARTADGVWHVGGTWIDAAGGGCTAPSLGTGSGLWNDRLGEIEARLWSHGDSQRLRYRVIHPMDTGLANGIPAFYIDSTRFIGDGGEVLAVLHMAEPVAENPVISLDFNGAGPVRIEVRDIQGNRFERWVRP